jgi:hypothetical protein
MMMMMMMMMMMTMTCPASGSGEHWIAKFERKRIITTEQIFLLWPGLDGNTKCDIFPVLMEIFYRLGPTREVGMMMTMMTMACAACLG